MTRTNKIISKYIILFVCYLSVLSAQAQRLPVDSQIFLNAPYSLYLEDYYTTHTTGIQVNLTLKDTYESSREVYLRLKIESSTVKLATPITYIPQSTFTLFPNQTETLYGDQLSEYFQLQNLQIVGPQGGRVANTGQLPEGFYNYSIVVVDKLSGQILSNEAFASAWLQLSEPPTITSPLSEALIDPQDPQIIQFGWQMTDMMPFGATGIEYKLWLYELMDETIEDPKLALANSKALPILASEPITINSLTYDISMPELERGKIYIYQVEAYDVGGRALFKNGGKSVIQWFRYGYPEEGILSAILPEDEDAFPLRGLKIFKWSVTDKRIDNQPFEYKIKIVESGKEQLAVDAIRENETWFEKRLSVTKGTFDYEWQLNEKNFDRTQRYAWQVICFSGSQMVAESVPQTFYGPPVMDFFRMGGHVVEVLNVTNKDTNHFAGKGKFKVGEGKYITCDFENLKLIDPAKTGRWSVQKGVIDYAVTDTSHLKKIDMTPLEEERNGKAYFHTDTIRLNIDGLFIKGKVEWPLPFANTGKFDGSLETKHDWINFGTYTLQGGIRFLEEENNIELLNPMGFGIQFRYPSIVYMEGDNKYKVSLFGDVLLPKNIESESGDRVKVPFSYQKHLFSFDYEGELEKFRALKGTGFWVEPTSIFMDFSEQESINKFASDKFWKGIYLKKFNIHTYQKTDGKERLKIVENLSHEKEDDENTDAWITGTGLHLKWQQNYNDTLYMHGFKGNLRQVKMLVDRGMLKEGELNGEVLLPFISEKKQFPFTMTLGNAGLSPGTFDDLDNTSFTLNKGKKETELTVSIHKPKFTGDDFVEMNLDIQWPELSAEIKNVGNFRIWSNYAIGFLSPNGTGALTNIINTTFDTYPMSIEGIGVGSSEGVYALGVVSKIVLGEDVSGTDGAPSVNIYSSILSHYAPKVEDYLETDYEIKSPSLVLEEKEKEYKKAVKDIESNLARRKQVALQHIPSRTNKNNAVDILSELQNAKKLEEAEAEKLGGVRALLNDQQREIFDEIVYAMVDELTKPLTNKIDTLAGRIEKNINNKIDTVTIRVADTLNVYVEQVVLAIGAEVGNVVAEISPTDISDSYEYIINGVNIGLQNHVKESLRSAVRDNVQDSITHLAKVVFAQRVNNKIRSLSQQIAISVMNGLVDTRSLEDSIVHGIPNMIVAMKEDVLRMASPQNLTTMVSNLGNDVANNLVNTEEIWAQIQAELLGTVKDQGLEDLTNLGTETLSALVPGDLTVSVPLNFSGFIASGDISDLVSLDSMPIHLETSAILLTGMVGYRPDDELYGTVFMGDLTLIVREPEEFAIRGTYVNGRKEEQSYWFAQLQTQDPDEEVGAPLSERAKPLKDPIKLGFVNLVAASGRIMKKMSIGANGFPVPDFNKSVSASIHFIVHDGNSSGELMRLEVFGKYDVAENGDYVIEFEGALALKSKAPKIEPDKKDSFAYGTVIISYNSAKKHFFGFAQASISGPVCAEASLLVDTQPGRWKVAVGSLEEPVRFIPACLGWGVRGFLDVDQETVEFGFGLEYSIYANYGFDIGVYGIGLEVSAGIAADVFAKIRYKPNFALMRAGVQITVWAGIGVVVKGPLKTRRINLIDIYVQGRVYVEFEPAPTKLVGEVSGHVSVLFFSKSFNASVNMELS